MSECVLILSSQYDVGTDEVSYWLHRMGVPYVRLNQEQLSAHRLSLDPIGPSLRIDGPTGKRRIDRELRSVLFRQPVFFRNTPPEPLSPAVQLQRSQWQGFVRGLTVFDFAAWMNFPASVYLAESKPYQLAVAKRCGFLVPKTVIGNDVRQFPRCSTDRIAIKSVDTVLVHEGSDTLFAFTMFPHLGEVTQDVVQDAPVIAQRFLQPKIDLRVTVVGNDLFAVKILGGDSGVEGDWRARPQESLRFVDTKLTAEVENSCRALMNELGLSFGRIDLAETADGTFFIEVNPTGEWSWLSGPSRPIGRVISRWLAAQRP